MTSWEADKEKGSLDGKAIGIHDEGTDLPRDPDAHLSEAEKAEVVSLAPQIGRIALPLTPVAQQRERLADRTNYRSAVCFGSWT